MTEDQNYLTIKTTGQAELDIRKSEFICTIGRINNEEEAKAFIDKVRTKNRKATHNCFAYVLGMNDEIQRESDDGEPSGTAGVPILRVLQNLELRNVCAVVTRYFGGIKLGAGGLIRAYSNTTSQAIEKTGVVQRVVQQQLFITIAYPLLGKLKNHLEQKQLPIINTQFTDKVKVEIAVDKKELDQIKEDLINFLNAQVEIEKGSQIYAELPYQLYQDEK